MKHIHTAPLLAAALIGVLTAGCNQEPAKPADPSAEDVAAIRAMMEKDQAAQALTEKSTKTTMALLLCASQVPPDADPATTAAARAKCKPLEEEQKRLDAERAKLKP